MCWLCWKYLNMFLFETVLWCSMVFNGFQWFSMVFIAPRVLSHVLSIQVNPLRWQVPPHRRGCDLLPNKFLRSESLKAELSVHGFLVLQLLVLSFFHNSKTLKVFTQKPSTFNSQIFETCPEARRGGNTKVRNAEKLKTKCRSKGCWNGHEDGPENAWCMLMLRWFLENGWKCFETCNLHQFANQC